MVLEHVGIAVSDLDRSIAFYCNAFGFRLMRKTPTNAFLYLGDQLLELIQGDLHAEPAASAAEEWQHQRVARFGLSHLALRVPAVEDAMQRIESAADGASLVVPPYHFEPDIEFSEHMDDERLSAVARPPEGERWKLAVVADPDGTLIELIER
jgi:catechol 2,3-dioxygenase-like lactoylglutathione lyase family enzyme